MPSNIDIFINGKDQTQGAFNSVKGGIDSLDRAADGMVSGSFRRLNDMLGVALKAAAIGAVAAFGALATGLGVAVVSAANMEQAIADIIAVFGKAAPPVEDLKKLIMDLGLDPKLKVTAVEAADAIEMLAKNGLTWEEISGGMARSTILLANATSDDFATAASVATDAMKQFNIPAGEMDEVINQIVGTTQQSKFDIDDYRLAIAQAGGVAGSVGVDFADFNAMIAATSSSFAGGSDAGTSFKVFLQQLIPDTNKSADAMRDLGLFSGLTGAEFNKVQEEIQKTQAAIAALDPTSESYGERLTELNTKLASQRAELVAGGSAFFDANGNMKSAEEITAALSTAFGGLSDAERISAASTIFGTDAMRTALALADAGEETVHKFKEAIGDTSAEEIAAIRTDTLKGKWEIFKGVLEATTTQIGDAFLPAAKNLTDWALDLATTKGPALTAWFSKLGTSLDEFVTKVRAGEDPMTAFRTSFDDLIPPEVMTKIDNFVAGVTKIIEEVGKVLAPFVSWQDALIGFSLVVGTTAVVAIGGFLLAMAPVALTIAGVTLAVAAFRTAWDEDWGGIQEKTKAAVDAITKNFTAMVTTITTGGPKISDWFQTTFPSSAATSVKSIDTLNESFKGFGLQTGITFVKTKGDWTDFNKTVLAVLDLALTQAIGKLTTFTVAFGSAFEAMEALQEGNWTKFWAAIGKVQEAQNKELLANQAAQDRASKAAAELIRTSLVAVYTEAGAEIPAGLKKGLDENASKATGAANALADGVKSGFAKPLEIESPSGVFKRYGASVVQGLIDGVGSLVGSVGTKMAEVVSAVKNLFSDAGNWLRQKGVDAVQGFIDGIGGMIGAAQAKVAELANLAAAAAAAALGIQSPSKVFMHLGEQSGEGYLIGLERKFAQVGGMFNGALGGLGGGSSTTTNYSSSNTFNAYVTGSGDAARDVTRQIDFYSAVYGSGF